jgi:AraC-like DNA-binding protein
MMQFEDAKSSDTNTLKAILNYCSENYTKDVQLDTISSAMHVKKYYVSHLFSQKLHMGFSEYIGMLRISDACKLLVNQDKSITDISYSVGFNSTRTFNRLFLKYTGVTPRQYKISNIPGMM